jgi:dTMP kinase
MIIALEGVDGSGKRTQTQLLEQRARAAGLNVASLSFPRYGITRFSRLIADYLNGRLGKLNEVPVSLAALLYAGDRMETRNEILSLQQSQDLLIFDRYVASNLAYQGAKVPETERRALINWIAEIEYGTFEMPKPDLNVLLDVPIDTASKMVLAKGSRTYTKQTADLHEADHAYLRASRQVYHSLTHSTDYGPWAVVASMDEAGELRSADTNCEDLWTVLGSTGALSKIRQKMN